MPTRNPRRAFTLLELMISVALALLMILGVNEVFSLTSKTVGAGQSLTSAFQNDRSAQGVIAADFQQAAPMSTTPAFVIESAYAFAFRNKADQVGDSDGRADTMDLPTGSITVPVALIGPHSHRLDRIGFFSRGFFQRQTGTSPAFIDTTRLPGTSIIVPFSSAEAWIVYGHLNVADNSGSASSSTFPGVGTPTSGGPAPITPPGPPASNPNNFYAAQWVLGRNVFLLAPTPSSKGVINAPGSQFQGLAPLSYTSTGNGSTIDTSRYDVAQTSITAYAAIMRAFLKGATAGSNTNVPDYWDALVSSTANRYVGNPYPVKSFTSDTTAPVVPCFVPGCSHFLVEYTGDFITQDPTTGAVQGAGPDGIPDFQVVNGNRQIRWYGLPRATTTNVQGNINASTDVVPLGTLLGSQQPFERVMPKAASGAYGGMSAGDRYVVAWGPDTQATSPPTPTPTMLRFTLIIDDMTNRTGAGQTFEYVVQLPQ